MCAHKGAGFDNKKKILVLITKRKVSEMTTTWHTHESNQEA